MAHQFIAMFSIALGVAMFHAVAVGQTSNQGGSPPQVTRAADGVSVTAPKNAAVRPDEAIHLEGRLRVQGEVADRVTATGRVEIGYFFAATVYNPQTGDWEEQDRFVVVRPVGVSGTVPPGIYGGRGLAIDFEQWVVANPRWNENTIYLCVGVPRDDNDDIGSFAVGRLPSSLVPWWLAWIFG